MSHLQGRCHRCGDEGGAALVMVLAFLSLFGLAIASLLGFSQTSFKTTVVVRSQAEILYAADGAVEGAINAVRYDRSAGVSATESACKGFDPPAINNVDLRVTCTGKVVTAGGGAPPRNIPDQAILTTDVSDVSGIVQGSRNEMIIGGDVLVNSRHASAIAVATNSKLFVDGDIRARGGCPNVLPKAGSTGTANCRGTNPVVPTPYYPIDALRATPAAVPSACGTSTVVRLSPGLYDSAIDLNRISACAKKVIWFQPGVYYFDFADAGSHKWLVAEASTYLIGGTPEAWNPDTASWPLATSPSCDPNSAIPGGVKFVFGNDSRLEVTSGHFEICATSDPTEAKQEIAVYAAPPATATPTSPQSVTFSNPPNTTAIDGSTTSDYVSSSTNKTTGSIDMRFSLLGLPVGAEVDSVKMRVAYRLVNSASVGALKATVSSTLGSPSLVINSPTGNGKCPDASLCNKGDEYHDVILDVSTALKGSTAATSLSRLTNASVKLEATVETPPNKPNEPGTIQLDGITLTINYTTAGFRSWGGCTSGSTYLASQDCALLKAFGDQSRVLIQGTVYAPSAPLDLQLTNRASQVVDRGVISSVLWLTPTASFVSGSTPISLPTVGRTRATGRTVTIRAYDGTTLLLVAAVAIDDNTSTLAPPVSVSHWSYQR